MNAPLSREQWLRATEQMRDLDLRAQQAREDAERPEPLWVSIALTLGIGFVVVCLVVARAWLG